jgi:hypothetical protein
LGTAAAAIPPALLAPPKGPNAGLGNQPIEFFTEPIAKLNAQEGAGIVPVQQQIDARKALIVALEAEITARAANKDMTDAEIKTLADLNKLLKEQRTALTDLQKLTPAGQLTSFFKELSEIVGKFSPGLNKMFSEIAAGNAALTASIKQLQVLGGTPTKPGSVLDGLGKIWATDSSTTQRIQGIMGAMGAIGGIASTIGAISQSTGGLSGALTGAMGGAEMGLAIGGPTPLGAALAGVGAIGGGIFGALTGAKRSQAAALTKQVTDSFKSISEAFNSGTVSLADTITQLTALQAKATASIKTGKKGNQTQMQAEIDAITSEVDQLKKQQKSVLDAFNQQIGIFALPTGAQDIASKIVAIAQALKTAADAGATAAQQIAYLNGAMAALQTTTAQGLRSDESDTLTMMQQSLDLKQQISDLNTNYNDAVLNVKRSLGLAAALTPEQQAAKQLKDLKTQHDQQLTALTDQQTLLQAQLDGRMELFGWTQKDLDATTAHAAIIAQELLIQQQITAETIAQYQAQEDMLAQMAAGKIPSLPAGTLPSGFTWPTGATYNQTITISFPSMPSNPADFAKIVSEGLKQLNKMGQIGLQ